MTTKTIVFDLDDTLIPEIEFLESAFSEIAKKLDHTNFEKLYKQMLFWYHHKENVFEKVEMLYQNTSLIKLKSEYRNHFPNFDKKSKNREILLELKALGAKLGLVTDGFSITQRNKIKAMDIESLFDWIIISEEFGSEKPTEANFSTFHRFKTDKYYYVGDNTSKDFVCPNQLGWKTICLRDNGRNIHKQNFNLDLVYLPNIIVNRLDEIKLHL